MIKEIFCDLDGTLYEELISDKDLKAILIAQEAGITFNIATGRVYSHTQSIIENANVDGYIICENGSYIYNNKGECVFKATFTDDNIKKIISAYETLNYLTDDEIIYFKYDGNVVIPQDGSCDQYFSNGYTVDQTLLYRETYNSKVGNIGMYSTDEKMLEKIVTDMAALLGNDFDVYISGPYTLNIVPRGVSKFDAIKMVCKKKNVTLDEVVTIGDSANDISMLRHVKMSFAMDSAKDSVKSVAGYYTPTVADAVKMIVDFNQMSSK